MVIAKAKVGYIAYNAAGAVVARAGTRVALMAIVRAQATPPAPLSGTARAACARMAAAIVGGGNG